MLDRLAAIDCEVQRPILPFAGSVPRLSPIDHEAREFVEVARDRVVVQLPARDLAEVELVLFALIGSAPAARPAVQRIELLFH